MLVADVLAAVVDVLVVDALVPVADVVVRTTGVGLLLVEVGRVLLDLAGCAVEVGLLVAVVRMVVAPDAGAATLSVAAVLVAAVLVAAVLVATAVAATVVEDAADDCAEGAAESALPGGGTASGPTAAVAGTDAASDDAAPEEIRAGCSDLMGDVAVVSRSRPRNNAVASTIAATRTAPIVAANGRIFRFRAATGEAAGGPRGSSPPVPNTEALDAVACCSSEVCGPAAKPTSVGCLGTGAGAGADCSAATKVAASDNRRATSLMAGRYFGSGASMCSSSGASIPLRRGGIS